LVLIGVIIFHTVRYNKETWRLLAAIDSSSEHPRSIKWDPHLANLERLLTRVEDLEEMREGGVPIYWKKWLYTGNGVYLPPLETLYEEIKNHIVSPCLKQLEHQLGRIKKKPPTATDDHLKAYRMLTEPEFLDLSWEADFLADMWANGDCHKAHKLLRKHRSMILKWRAQALLERYLGSLKRECQQSPCKVPKQNIQLVEKVRNALRTAP